MQRLEAGEIVATLTTDAAGDPVGMSMGIIDAKPDRVWATLTDFGRYNDYYTGISSSEIRKREGKTQWVYFVIDFPWPLPDRWTLNETHIDAGNRSFDWKRVEGTVKKYEGVIHVFEWPGNRSLLRFVGVLDPGFPFFPRWLMAYFQAQSLPGVISGPRDYLIRTTKGQ